MIAKMGSEGEENESNGWSDWEETESLEETKCLLCEEVLETFERHFQHLQSQHGFDFPGYIRTNQLNTYDCIRLINYIRKNARDFCQESFEPPRDRDIWKQDCYYAPVLDSDAFLTFDFESFLEEEKVEEKGEERCETEQKMKGRIEILENMVQKLQETLQSVMIDSDVDSCISVEKTGSSKDCLKQHEKLPMSEYFQGYSHFGIHEEMLKDVIRTDSYRQFILQNKHLFAGKVVLDVGCGTGILSMFAADAGAAQVIGVDMSNIVSFTHRIVELNGFSDKITILQGKMEEVDLTEVIQRPDKKVDIIISEWMGYFLFYESMLDSVLYARDRWMAAGGKVFPDISSLYITSASLPDRHRESFEFWDNVYGFDMSPLKESVFKDVSIEVVPQNSISSPPFLFQNIDANVVHANQLQFSTAFSLVIRSQVLDSQNQAKISPCNAFVVYFESFFEKDCSHVIKLSTSPLLPPTHWKQAVLYLENPLLVTIGDVIQGEISLHRLEKNHRGLEIDLKYSFQNQTFAQKYILE
eukprot:Sdes_comp19976_c0_seq1m12548